MATLTPYNVHSQTPSYGYYNKDFNVVSQQSFIQMFSPASIDLVYGSNEELGYQQAYEQNRNQNQNPNQNPNLSMTQDQKRLKNYYNLSDTMQFRNQSYVCPEIYQQNPYVQENLNFFSYEQPPPSVWYPNNTQRFNDIMEDVKSAPYYDQHDQSDLFPQSLWPKDNDFKAPSKTDPIWRPYDNDYANSNLNSNYPKKESNPIKHQNKGEFVPKKQDFPQKKSPKLPLNSFQTKALNSFKTKETKLSEVLKICSTYDAEVLSNTANNELDDVINKLKSILVHKSNFDNYELEKETNDYIDTLTKNERSILCDVINTKIEACNINNKKNLNKDTNIIESTEEQKLEFSSELDRLMQSEITTLQTKWSEAGGNMRRLNKYIYGNEVNWDDFNINCDNISDGVKYLYNELEKDDNEFVTNGPIPETLTLSLGDVSDFVYLSVYWTDTRWHCSPIRIWLQSEEGYLDIWVKPEREISQKTMQQTGLSYKNGWYEYSNKVAGEHELYSEEDCCKLLLQFLRSHKNPILVSHMKNCHDSNSLFRLMKKYNLATYFTQSVRGFVNASSIFKRKELNFYDGPHIYKAKIAQFTTIGQLEQNSYSIDFLNKFYEYSKQCRVKWCSLSDFFKNNSEPFLDYSHGLRLAHAGFDYKMLQEIYEFGGLDGLMLMKKVVNRNSYSGNYVMKPKMLAAAVVKKMFAYFQTLFNNSNAKVKRKYIHELGNRYKDYNDIMENVKVLSTFKNVEKVKNKKTEVSLPSGRLPTSLLFGKIGT